MKQIHEEAALADKQDRPSAVAAGLAPPPQADSKAPRRPAQTARPTGFRETGRRDTCQPTASPIAKNAAAAAQFSQPGARSCPASHKPAANAGKVHGQPRINRRYQQSKRDQPGAESDAHQAKRRCAISQGKQEWRRQVEHANHGHEPQRQRRRTVEHRYQHRTFRQRRPAGDVHGRKQRPSRSETAGRYVRTACARTPAATGDSAGPPFRPIR